jgi:hypothetical protein
MPLPSEWIGKAAGNRCEGPGLVQVTILLPTKGAKLYRVRKAGETQQCQQWIYRALGFECKNFPWTPFL